MDNKKIAKYLTSTEDDFFQLLEAVKETDPIKYVQFRMSLMKYVIPELKATEHTDKKEGKQLVIKWKDEQ